MKETDFEFMLRIADEIEAVARSYRYDSIYYDRIKDAERLRKAAEDVANYQDMRNS